jgi:hypothetical protein
LTAQQLFGWRWAARGRSESETAESGSAFAPVIVEAAPPCADTSVVRLGGSPVIEIVIGAATVRLLRGVDTATLTTVLRAMRSAT